MKFCRKHPQYRAIRRPSSGCARCRLIWLWRCIRKNLGLAVPTAKPRLKKLLVTSEIVRGYKPVHPQTLIPILYKREVSDKEREIIEKVGEAMPAPSEAQQKAWDDVVIAQIKANSEARIRNLSPQVFPPNMDNTIEDCALRMPASELPVAPENRGPDGN